MKHLFSSRLKYVFLICCTGTITIKTLAQNTWTGTTDGDWHKACNWSMGTIPTAANNVVIPTVATYPTITGIAHCLSISITSAAANTLTLNSGGGGSLCVASTGGSCAGTPTDNGGCGCSNLNYQYFSASDPGFPDCDVSGACGTQCKMQESCEICHTPVLCLSLDCLSPCGTDCGGWNVYTYAP